MEYLREYFDVTVFYYNPNITEEAEYRKRVEEEKRLIAAYNSQVDAFWKRFGEGAPAKVGSGEVGCENGTCSESDAEHYMEFPGGIRVTGRTAKIEIMEGDYDRDSFWELSKGLETCPEGGERCFKCYELRLRRTAEVARKEGFDLFTTTLTISPLKNAEKLNEIGQQVGAELGIAFLPSDFKKRNGYKRSVELSAAYDLYRQDYCGCVYSLREKGGNEHGHTA
jgi:predicted adenine nucleotide alpha hydrolase (AANH) superfamily ATPase